MVLAVPTVSPPRIGLGSGETRWQEDVNKSDPLCQSVQVGPLPESRAPVVLCGGQAGGWGTSGSVRSPGPCFTAGDIGSAQGCGRGLVLRGRRDGHS